MVSSYSRPPQEILSCLLCVIRSGVQPLQQSVQTRLRCTRGGPHIEMYASYWYISSIPCTPFRVLCNNNACADFLCTLCGDDESALAVRVSLRYYHTPQRHTQAGAFNDVARIPVQPRVRTLVLIGQAWANERHSRSSELV